MLPLCWARLPSNPENIRGPVGDHDFNSFWLCFDPHQRWPGSGARNDHLVCPDRRGLPT